MTSGSSMEKKMRLTVSQVSNKNSDLNDLEVNKSRLIINYGIILL